MVEKKLPRDVFVDTLYEEARKDKDIYLLSADFGGRALENFRKELPGQFLFMGICEQNMINLAQGLSLAGNKPYCYAMDSFIAIRCLEQIKLAAITMQIQPNTYLNLIGVGAGFGYKDAGPTHYTTEQIGILRCIPNIEIISPCDSISTKEAAKLSYSNYGLRYVRLDREYLPNIYEERIEDLIKEGMYELEKGYDSCIITTGYMVSKALELKKRLNSFDFNIGVIDLFRVKPLNKDFLLKKLENYKSAITLEEHFTCGGVGELIASILKTENTNIPLKTIGVDERYYFENASNSGGREYIHKLAGIDIDTLMLKIKSFIDDRNN